MSPTNFMAVLENTAYQAGSRFCRRLIDERRLRIITHASDGRVQVPMILRALLKGLLPVMRGVDDGANGGLAFGGPHGAVTVGHLPLHNGRTKQPLLVGSTCPR